jgi:transcriptional regulator GlxA family with amidase domain
MRIAIVAFEQFTDIDVFLAWDLFNRVRRDDWQVLLVGTAPTHTSASGLVTPMHEQIEWANEADIVFFSSGPGTRRLYQDADYLSRFRLDPTRQYIGSMCSGALILAGLGLLGPTATTYPTSRAALEATGVTVVEEDLVVHGRVGTAAGCLAALQLVGWMLEHTEGSELRDYVLDSVQPITQGLRCSYGQPLPAKEVLQP